MKTRSRSRVVLGAALLLPLLGFAALLTLAADAGASGQPTVQVSYSSDPVPSPAAPAASSGPPQVVTSAATTGAGSSTGVSGAASPKAGPNPLLVALGAMVLVDLAFLLITIWYRPKDLLVGAGRRALRILRLVTVGLPERDGPAG